MTDTEADDHRIGEPGERRARRRAGGRCHRPDRRPGNRTARFAWGAVAVILVGVVALVVYALTDPTRRRGWCTGPPTVEPTWSRQLTKVPASVFDAVGVTAPDTRWWPPTVLTGQPPLQSSGQARGPLRRRRVLPVLRRRAVAADRGPVPVRALRRPHTTCSRRQLSVFPDIQTFSFVGSDLHQPVRHLHRRRAVLRRRRRPGRLHPDRHAHPGQAALVARYGTGRRDGRGPGTFPFVDIGNPMVTSTSGFSPAVDRRASPSRPSPVTLEPDRRPDHPGHRGLGQLPDRRDLRGHRPAARVGLHQQGGAGRRARPRARADHGRGDPWTVGPGRPTSGLSRPGGRPSACAPSRSGRPRCRGARGCGWRSRGTPTRTAHVRQIDLARSSRWSFSSLRSAWAGGKKISACGPRHDAFSCHVSSACSTVPNSPFMPPGFLQQANVLGPIAGNKGSDQDFSPICHRRPRRDRPPASAGTPADGPWAVGSGPDTTLLSVMDVSAFCQPEPGPDRGRQGRRGQDHHGGGPGPSGRPGRAFGAGGRARGPRRGGHRLRQRRPPRLRRVGAQGGRGRRRRGGRRRAGTVHPQGRCGPGPSPRTTPSSSTWPTTGCGGSPSGCMSSGIIDLVAGAIPGIRDVLVLGKVKQIERSRIADLVLVDAPATGHTMTFLSSAGGLLDAARGGPIRTQAADVVDLLSDPARCQVALVTLPEEMPVNEVIEAAYQLEDKVGIALGPVIVNGCYPPRRPTGHAGRPGGSRAAGVALDPDAGRRPRPRPGSSASPARSSKRSSSSGWPASFPCPSCGCRSSSPPPSAPTSSTTLSAALAAGVAALHDPAPVSPSMTAAGPSASTRWSATGRSSSAAVREGWGRPPPRPPSPCRRPGWVAAPAW